MRFLHGKIEQPDVSTPLVEYGEDFSADELPPIASADLPFGIPAWMRQTDCWALLPQDDPGTEQANTFVRMP